MAARFGEVLYWLGVIIAALLAALAAVGFIWGTGTTEPFAEIVALIMAGIVWLIGRACRYVLAGR
jgi:hypothetical protein